MPAKKNQEQSPFGEGGDLSQDLIDQMLNGGDLGDLGDLGAGDLGALESSIDPWSDDALQAEIGAARLAAGVGDSVGLADVAPMPSMVERSAPVTVAAAPTPISAAPSAMPTAVHPVQFMPLSPEMPTNDRQHGIEMLMDVALEVSVELGRSHMSIGEILGLRTGSVVELDKLAGEPVDVSVNGTLIARGEVVVVDEKFGVRITEVVSKARRLASLG
jgi:flagellar motor switch protein FliN